MTMAGGGSPFARASRRSAPGFIVGMALVLGGCAVVQAGDGGSRKLFVGAVRLDLPATGGRLSAVAVRNLGLGWDHGPFLGWRDSSWVIADPKECQMVVIVRSGTEADHASKLLEQLKGENICIADFHKP